MGYILPISATALALTLLGPRHFPAYFPASALSTFVSLFVLQYVLAFLYNVVIYPAYISPLRHLPSPPGWPIIGVFLQIFKMPNGHPMLEMVKTVPNDGLIVYRGLWNRERVLPTSAKILQEALHTKSYVFAKPQLLQSDLASVLGHKGILFTEGDLHRHQRKILQPAFSWGHIKTLVPIFWDISRRLNERVAAAAKPETEEEEEKGKIVEMIHYASLATLDIIGEAGLGYNFNALESNGEEGELAKAYNSIFQDVSIPRWVRLMAMLLPSWFVRSLPFERKRVVEQARGTLQRVSNELIERKRKELQEGKESEESRDILTVLLKSGEFESKEGQEVCRDQLMTFLAAGHETTATALTWALHALSENLPLQRSLRTEIRNAFPSGCPEHLDYATLDSLRLLRNVAEETLRCYPPVVMTLREATAATTLGGHLIPKGTWMVLSPWAINRDPSVWGEDADQFRPDRWENEKAMQSNYNVLTFLHGPRGCIGKDFSKAEFKALLCCLIGRFEVESLGEKIELQSGITSKPKGGLRVRVRDLPGWV